MQTGKDFADREVEMENIIRDLKDGQNIFLISPRRYGKTSLIMNALEKLQCEGFYTAYIDRNCSISCGINSKHETLNSKQIPIFKL